MMCIKFALSINALLFIYPFIYLFLTRVHNVNIQVFKIGILHITLNCKIIIYT